MNISARQIADFHRDGFILLKGVFSPDEIRAMRETFGRLPPAQQKSFYLYELPGLERLWADPRLTAPARQILGEPIIYYFDGHLLRYCGASLSMRGRHLHHDAKGTPQNPYNRVNTALTFTYPILRIGIYLQDTRNQSGGIKVVPGSHLRDVSTFDEANFEYHNVESEPGDVLMFTHRLLHSPFALRLADQPGKALSPVEELRLLKEATAEFLPMPEIRETIFLNFAGRHELSDIHIKHCALINDGIPGLSDHLFAAGYLDGQQTSPVSLRVDSAIVETVNAAAKSSAAKDDQRLLFHLMRLLKLCRHNQEHSPHYPLFNSEIPDDSPETALKVYQNVARHMNAHNALGQQAVRDRHMTEPTV